MLESTFMHVPGVGHETERSLWRQGCETWSTYLAEPGRFCVGKASPEVVSSTLLDSQSALAEGRHQFFAHALGSSEAWRAWPVFRSRCAYLDIETDGGRSGSSITTIGIYDGKEYRCLVKGEDLEHFPELISRYSMVVTFFGLGFDIPMLRRKFTDVHFDHVHLDLCFALRQVGVRGGLKRIEQQIGISRTEATNGLNGLDAIRLWREYKRGNAASLQTLIEYNREDVVNLEALAGIAYERLQLRARGLVSV